MDFTDTITTLHGLREVIAPPSELVTAKEIDSLDDYCRDFIARSPFRRDRLDRWRWLDRHLAQG